MPEPVPPPVLPVPRPSAILGQLALFFSCVSLAAYAVLMLANPG